MQTHRWYLLPRELQVRRTSWNIRRMHVFLSLLRKLIYQLLLRLMSTHIRDNQASSAVLKAYDRAQSSLAEEEGTKTLLKLISGAAYIIGTPVEKAANWHKK